MLENVKSFFSKLIVSEPENVLKASPIEVNPTVNKLTNRKEARLGRLLSIKDPSKEIKEEIKKLKAELKGN